MPGSTLSRSTTPLKYQPTWLDWGLLAIYALSTWTVLILWLTEAR